MWLPRLRWKLPAVWLQAAAVVELLLPVVVMNLVEVPWEEQVDVVAVVPAAVLAA